MPENTRDYRVLMICRTAQQAHSDQIACVGSVATRCVCFGIYAALIDKCAQTGMRLGLTSLNIILKLIFCLLFTVLEKCLLFNDSRNLLSRKLQ